jgi:hypothetical protein
MGLFGLSPKSKVKEVVELACKVNGVDCTLVNVFSCPVKWKEMDETESSIVRKCGKCRNKVYDISSMSSDEIEELVKDGTEGVCFQAYVRSDGTLVSGECLFQGRQTRGRIVAVSTSLGREERERKLLEKRRYWKDRLDNDEASN